MSLGPLFPLAAYRQFVVYQKVPLPNGKTNKIPCSPVTGLPVDVHDPTYHLDYEGACRAAAHWGSSFSIGFVLTKNDPFWCVDIDGCKVGDGWSQTARDVVDLLAGAVCEISQSGNGLHIWGRGPIPDHRKRNSTLGLELYSDQRFIALGDTENARGTMAPAVPGIDMVVAGYFGIVARAPTVVDHGDGPCPEWRGPTDDDDLLRRALRSVSAANVFDDGVTFHDLWTHNVPPLARKWPSDKTAFDESYADASLMAHLMFWTGRDRARIKRIMHRPDNGLLRSKYDESRGDGDYLDLTFDELIKRGAGTVVCQDKPLEIPASLRPAVPDDVVLPGPVAVSAPAVAAVPVPSAVSATDPAPGPSAPDDVAGATFLNADHQRQLFAGCVYVQDQHRILIPGGTLLKPDQFKARFGGFTFLLDNRNEKTTRDAWEAFTQSQALRWPRADSVTFEPLHPYGALIQRGGLTLVNTWWPVPVRRVKGDPKPFLDHVRRLLPNERDYWILIYYLAAIVQNPGRKAQWAPLIIGVEGNGKSAISFVLAYAVGDRYVHWPAADKLDGQFNGWMYGKLLYCVEDIHKADIEKLKPMITATSGFEIERKGVDQFNAIICGNWIFNSNHKDSVRKTRNDRRFAVLYCAQQAYDDLVRDGMAGEYMQGQYNWLNNQDGLAIVADFLHTVQIPDEFNPFVGCPRAPDTSSTEEAIQASLGPAEQEVVEATLSDRQGFRNGWVSGLALDALLKECGRASPIPRSRRRAFMQTLGYDWHPALKEGRTNDAVLPDAARVVLYVHRDNPDRNLTAYRAVVEAYSRAQGIGR